MINQKVIYTYRGKDYSNCHDIRQSIENKMGVVIDDVDQKANFSTTPKMKLELLELLTDPVRSKALIEMMEEYQEAERWIKSEDQ